MNIHNICFHRMSFMPALVAQSDACPTCDQEVEGSISYRSRNILL